MKKTLLELADQTVADELQAAYGETADAKVLAEHAKRYAQTEKILKELMRLDNQPKSCPKIKLSEAVHTADFRILFPRVVMQVLQQPNEPLYVGQNLLAQTIQVDGAKVMEFPTLGAIRAFELGDTQEPPEQDPSFSKNITEIRVRRFGLKLDVTADVIAESQWDVLSLYIKAAGAAMRRKKEELIFNEFNNKSVTLFDNSDTRYPTTGVKSDGLTKNGTFDHMDLLDMMAALAANGYNPSHVLLHPLSWSVWAKDPFLRFQLLYSGGMGQHLGVFSGTDRDMNASQYIPFGLQPVVTPFQTLTYNTSLTNGAVAVTGLTAANYTSITVLDNSQAMLLLQRTPMSMVSFENPVRDIQSMMFQEKYGLSVLNGGRASVVAKNVRIDQNYGASYTIKTVTAA